VTDDSKSTRSSRALHIFYMSMFLFVFLILYAGLHIYLFVKARAAFSLGTGGSIGVLLFLALMVFAPLLTRLLEKPGLDYIGRPLAYVGYTWMAIVALFFCSSIIIDILRLLVRIAGFIGRRDFSGITHQPLVYFLVPFGIALFIAIYGYFEAWNVQPERMTIKTPKIPAEIGSFKIVQISDVHLGIMVGEKKLENILELVQKENPDLLVSTGDLVDGEMYNVSDLIGLLKQVNPKYGKYAIPGNHEYYAGIEKALKFTRDAGFTVLRGERTDIAGIINLAGVDDPAGRYQNPSKWISEKELLSPLPKDKFTLFLKHRPLIDKDAVGLFDLQLSGHAHKGQIFPISLITAAVYPIDEGSLKLDDGEYLYVSKGAGTWGPPIRFLAPPDIVVIELVHQDVP
jgi:predicted MPP superfamily phosphohydrolase